MQPDNNKKRKVAFITELFPPSIGGQEQRFLEIANSLGTQGHTVEVYTIDHTGKLPTYENEGNVEIFRLIKAPHYTKGIIGGRRITDIFRFTFALRKKMASRDYELVFINQWPVLPAIFSPLIVPNTKFRILDFVEYRSSLVWRVLNRLMLTGTRNVVCISEGVRERLSVLSSSKNSMIVIPSLVEASRYYSQVKDRFIFLGRLQPHKHPEDAIKAVIQWNNDHGQSIPLDLVGDGELLAGLKEKYKKYPFIIFHGFVDDNKKFELLSKSYLLILPSEREGLPKSMIEAMASTVPTLTTDYRDNGTKEFVTSHEIGLTVIPDIDAITKGMEIIMSDLSYYQNNCRQLIDQHDLKPGTQALLDFAS